MEDLGGGGDHEAMFSEMVCVEQQREQMIKKQKHKIGRAHV